MLNITRLFGSPEPPWKSLQSSGPPRRACRLRRRLLFFPWRRLMISRASSTCWTARPNMTRTREARVPDWRARPLWPSGPCQIKLRLWLPLEFPSQSSNRATCSDDGNVLEAASPERDVFEAHYPDLALGRRHLDEQRGGVALEDAVIKLDHAE